MKRSKNLLYFLAVAIAVVYIATAASFIDLMSLSSSRCWRVVYMFLHGGFLHAAANVMCLLAIARSGFRVPVHFVIFAILAAACAPMTDGAMTLGGSGICYALLGAMSWQSIDIKRYHSLIALFLVLGVLPWLHVNYMLHAFCYVEGVLFGWICSE